MKIADIYRDLPTIETERLLLRKVKATDTKAIYAYASDPEVARYVTWPVHTTIGATQAFVQFVIEQYRKHDIAPWGMVVKETDDFIGTIDFVAWQPQHYTAEIGYTIGRKFWNKGYTSEAAEALIDFGFHNMELERIQARCMVDNVASARVMEKAGMSYEGTIRRALYVKEQHQDLKLYSILRNEWRDNRL
ncbi:GNAT family N-acetyltransferase [Priestia koreensis]|uniref:GNAT family N-acetyltransferase n=1 Tax=Priestia koreensis TaxID=284581 RepID=UPI001F570050|nr:GNAT family protein [Priestia koreensis]MCM3004190.1 GNAT family N-acetyltransferase [Priestia koreensis]UNL83407.1 GNAT family N-acetyltransferase [Priestia koreensis]